MLTVGGRQVLAIDSDAHVIESEHTWSYLEPDERKYCPKLVGAADEPGRKYWVLDDKIIGFRFPSFTAQKLDEMSERTGRDLHTTTESRELDRVEQRLQHMDRVGIDIQIMHNTLWIEEITKRPEVELALVRAYNRWLGDVWSQSGGRLRWSCLPSTRNISAAVEEVRWSKQHGAAGICLRPIEGEYHLGSPYFYPLYEEAIRQNLPITVHIANGSGWYNDLVRHSQFWRFRLPTLGACFSYLRSETPEVFPTLRVGFIEAGAQWLVYVLEAASRPWGISKDRLHEVLGRKNVWVACEYEDDLPYLLPRSGEDNLIIGTDYGHTDPFSNARALNEFIARGDISDCVKKKIVCKNARTYYGIEDAEVPEYVLQTAAVEI